MQPETTQQTDQNKVAPHFPLLSEVTRPNVTTAEVAYYLNRRPQTVRGWACFENGPIRPLRIHGRLAWSTDALRKLVVGDN